MSTLEALYQGVMADPLDGPFQPLADHLNDSGSPRAGFNELFFATTREAKRQLRELLSDQQQNIQRIMEDLSHHPGIGKIHFNTRRLIATFLVENAGRKQSLLFDRGVAAFPTLSLGEWLRLQDLLKDRAHFTNVRLTEVTPGRLGEILNHPAARHLINLDLSGNNLRDENWEGPPLQNLKRLLLRKCRMESGDFNNALAYLSSCKSLERLDVSENRILGADAWDTGIRWQDFPDLRRLDFGDCSELRLRYAEYALEIDAPALEQVGFDQATETALQERLQMGFEKNGRMYLEHPHGTPVIPWLRATRRLLRQPMDHMRVYYDQGLPADFALEMKKTFQHPRTRHMRSLALLGGISPKEQGLENIFSSMPLSVRELETYVALANADIAALMRWPGYSTLESLWFDDDTASDALLSPLLTTPPPELHFLACKCSLDELACSPLVQQLKTFRLFHQHAKGLDIRKFAAIPWGPLQKLVLQQTGIGTEAAFLLAAFAGQRHLQSLDVHDNRIKDEGARVLAEAVCGKGGTLFLTENPITNGGALKKRWGKLIIISRS